MHHTLDVFNAAERLGKMERVSADELMLLNTAALFHDAGFLERYEENESIAVRIVNEQLPRFGYSPGQILIIANMIKATNIKNSPQTHLEKILCDADLDYLGRDDFHVHALALKKELNAHGMAYDNRQWDEMQVKFFEKHTYHTASAIKLREAVKQKHLQEINKRLKAV